MNSLATYELTPSDSQVSCKNPNGTVQAFEKVP